MLEIIFCCNILIRLYEMYRPFFIMVLSWGSIWELLDPCQAAPLVRGDTVTLNTNYNINIYFWTSKIDLKQAYFVCLLFLPNKAAGLSATFYLIYIPHMGRIQIGLFYLPKSLVFSFVVSMSKTEILMTKQFSFMSFFNFYKCNKLFFSNLYNYIIYITL